MKNKMLTVLVLATSMTASTAFAFGWTDWFPQPTSECPISDCHKELEDR